MALRVTKWYLDVCTDEGAVAIAYAARIHWRRMRLHYSAVLERSPDGEVFERMTLRGFREPREDAGTLRWEQPRLGVSASWRPLRERTPVEHEPQGLLQTPEGDVIWNLRSGRAEVDWNGERRHRGLGYVERLDVTLPPWDLPIDELRWGRFVGRGGDAAWIEWRGAYPLRLLWKNGASVLAESFVVGGAEAPGPPSGTLSTWAPDELGLALSEPKLLRDGPLVSTVFDKVPVLRRTLPARMLAATETKWCSAGRLSDGTQGWAIHEVVRWPAPH